MSTPTLGYSDDKKKEYGGRFIGGALSFMFKKLGVPDELASSFGNEVGGFLSGVELSEDSADTVEKHWNQALDRTWERLKKKSDLPNEFWEPLEESLFRTPDSINMFLGSYDRRLSSNEGKGGASDLYTQLDVMIKEIHKDSEIIDVESIPEGFSEELLNTLKQEIANDISLLNSVQNYALAIKLESVRSLPYKGATTVALTTIPAQDENELIGREKEISEIRMLLEQHSVVSVCANGGVGKTAVAARIINDIKETIIRGEVGFEHIAWIRSTGDLKRDLSVLDLPTVDDASSIEDKFKAACAFLKMTPTFLVIDNMDDPPSADEINILNTISGSTKILITTRVKIKKTVLYLLNALSEPDAILLFYTHYLNDTAGLSIDNDAEKGYVEKIVSAASCNALLIELIAKMAYWEYSHKLEGLWGSLEKDVFGIDSEIDIDTDHAVSHSVDESSESDLRLQGQIRDLYQMSSLDDTKQEIMRFFAIFPAGTIIFTDAFRWAGFSMSDLKYLTDRGWVEKSGEGYLIHTTVKGSIELQKSDLDIEKYESLIEGLCDTDQYLSITTDYTKIAERIVVPEAICRLLAVNDNQKESTAKLFYNIAGVYQAQGDYTKALEYYKKALEIREKVLGPEHPDTATVYNNIALVYGGQGDYAKALEYYKKALEIREKVLGLKHPDTAATYNNIAGVYWAQGDHAKALEYYKKALEIREKVLGPEHPDTATTYNDTAGVYQVEGDHTKALEYYKKALQIREKVLGSKHPDTATTYNNIAGVYQAQGDHTKALEYYKKALEIREKVLGPEHPDTAGTYNNIALVYQDQGDHTKVLEYLNKALKISEKVLGLEHPVTATTYNNIAGLYQAQGDYEKALEYYKKALEIKEKALGPEHPDTATMYHNKAGVYMDRGNYAEALEYYMKALAISERALGPEHLVTAAMYKSIARVYGAQSDYTKALEYYKKALEIIEKAHGPEHLDTAATYHDIGFVYRFQGDYAKALEYFMKALVSIEKVLGPEHPDTATVYDSIAGVYSDLGIRVNALKYYKKVLRIREKVLGAENLSTARTYIVIAGEYYAQGLYVKALKYYKNAQIISEKAYGMEHPYLTATYNNIAIVYKAQGNYAKALEYYKKALESIEKAQGLEHPDTATTYNNIGALYYEMDNYEQAKEYLQMAYDIRLKVLGKDHPYTEGAKESLEMVTEKRS